MRRIISGIILDKIEVERLKVEKSVRTQYQDARNRNGEEGTSDAKDGHFIAFESGAQAKGYRWLEYKGLR